MAKKLIKATDCDACLKKDGSEVPAVEVLTIGPDQYDLCETHYDRFRGLLSEALAPSHTLAA
ncbi:hypothetical protein ACFV1L_06015 [Kitasatospora sp. NPDC059646]|uniref:hypothetical protein n=1 Tax=Kitasatospora sp. NPDC059646 TaxID=3346893 RepID=UPI0036C9F8FA